MEQRRTNQSLSLLFFFNCNYKITFPVFFSGSMRKQRGMLSGNWKHDAPSELKVEEE
jgi:hypothetical protein